MSERKTVNINGIPFVYERGPDAADGSETWHLLSENGGWSDQELAKWAGEHKDEPMAKGILRLLHQQQFSKPNSGSVQFKADGTMINPPPPLEAPPAPIPPDAETLAKQLGGIDIKPIDIKPLGQG